MLWLNEKLINNFNTKLNKITNKIINNKNSLKYNLMNF